VDTSNSLPYRTRTSIDPGYRNSATEEESFKKLTVDLQHFDKTVTMNRQAAELLCPSFNAFIARISTRSAACYLMDEKILFLSSYQWHLQRFPSRSSFKLITLHCKMLERSYIFFIL
jgi:hypothetical protein